MPRKPPKSGWDGDSLDDGILLGGRGIPAWSLGKNKKASQIAKQVERRNIKKRRNSKDEKNN